MDDATNPDALVDLAAARLRLPRRVGAHTLQRMFGLSYTEARKLLVQLRRRRVLGPPDDDGQCEVIPAEALVSYPTLSPEDAARFPSDESLLERVVRYAPNISSFVSRPRWSCVSGVTCLGSGFSSALCRRFGLNPDEEVPPGDCSICGGDDPDCLCNVGQDEEG